MIGLRFLNIVSVGVITALLCACVVTSGIKSTNSIAADGANLKLYKTYSWYQPTPAENASYDKGYQVSLHNRIKESIEENLKQKGYTKVDSKPDVLVAYDVSVSVPLEKDKPENFAPGFGYSYAYMSGFRYSYDHANQPGYRSADLFKSGTLIIDLINPVSNQLVWRGWTEGAIENFNASSKKVNQEVQQVLSKL